MNWNFEREYKQSSNGNEILSAKIKWWLDATRIGVGPNYWIYFDLNLIPGSPEIFLGHVLFAFIEDHSLFKT